MQCLWEWRCRSSKTSLLDGLSKTKKYRKAPSFTYYKGKQSGIKTHICENPVCDVTKDNTTPGAPLLIFFVLQSERPNFTSYFTSSQEVRAPIFPKTCLGKWLHFVKHSHRHTPTPLIAVPNDAGIFHFNDFAISLYREIGNSKLYYKNATHYMWLLAYSFLVSPKQKTKPCRISSTTFILLKQILNKYSFSLCVYSMVLSSHSKNAIKTGKLSLYYFQLVMICVLYKLIRLSLLIYSILAALFFCLPTYQILRELHSKMHEICQRH